MAVAPARIRVFRPDDCERVLALWRATEGVGLDKSDTQEGLTRFLERNPNLSLVAEAEQGEIVGAVLCGHDGRRGYLHHLAVAKSHRGQGLGSNLVEICLRNLTQLGITKCNLHVFAANEAGLRFWQKQSWSVREDLVLVQKLLG